MFSIARLGTVLSPARRSDHGFTLIELMVAVGMLGVALVAMSVMFTLSFATARGAQNRLEAKAEAQRMLERLRTLPYFVAFSDQIAGSDPDILDRFFVNATDTEPGVVRTIDSVATTGYYTGNLSTTCSQTVSPPECAYVSTFQVSKPVRGRHTLMLRFIRGPTEDGSPITDPQIVAAPADFDSNVGARDTPPSKLALATIQIDWTEAGRPLSYSIDSIIYGTRTIPQKSSGIASAGGGKVTGPKFQDGAVLSDVIATLGLTTGETTESDIQTAVAKATILEVRQLNPATGVDLGPNSFMIRPEGTASDSRTSEGTTFPAKEVAITPPGQTLFSVDGAGALVSGAGSGHAYALTSLSSTPPHSGGLSQPEALATQTVSDLVLYYRPSLLSAQNMTIQNIESRSEVASTSSQIRSTATTTITGVRIYGTHDYDALGDYQGIVKIATLSVTAVASSSGTFSTASARVTWKWTGFEIWNPASNQYDPADASGGGVCEYGASPPFAGYPACTNIVIPPGFGVPLVGETYETCSTCSLAISIGTNHEFASLEGQVAQASQRGLLTFYFKNQGARTLETTIFSLGSANAEVTYRPHH